jgi:polysaccharide biosynthesis/export protein
MRKVLVAGALIVAMAVAGCTATRSPAALDDGPETSSSAMALASPAAGRAPAANAISAAAPVTIPVYKLNPFDKVEVAIFQVPDLNRTVQVSESGTIELPLVGTVKAEGKTIEQLKNDVTRAYGSRYVNNPTVTVTVVDYGSQKVTVEGSVMAPGVYSIAGNGSLLQVIAMAKGIDRVGDTKGVMVFRMQGNERLAGAFDIDQIRSGKASDPTLQGGDVVVVPESAARAGWRDIREAVGVVGAFGRFAI